jgi:hypothetical protein
LILGRLWSKVRDLEEAGYTWAFIGHMKTKTERNPVTKQEETKLREATYPSVAKKILTRSDFKLTAYAIPKTVDVLEEKTIPGRGKINLKTGTKTETVYFLDTVTTEARDNKSRGVPTMDKRFELPLIGGWSSFETRYNAAVEAARAQS